MRIIAENRVERGLLMGWVWSGQVWLEFSSLFVVWVWCNFFGGKMTQNAMYSYVAATTRSHTIDSCHFYAVKEILKNVKLMQISKLQFTHVHLTNKNSCKGNWSRRGLQFFAMQLF